MFYAKICLEAAEARLDKHLHTIYSDNPGLRTHVVNAQRSQSQRQIFKQTIVGTSSCTNEHKSLILYIISLYWVDWKMKFFVYFLVAFISCHKRTFIALFGIPKSLYCSISVLYNNNFVTRNSFILQLIHKRFEVGSLFILFNGPRNIYL